MTDADRFEFSSAFMRIVELHAPYGLKSDDGAVKRMRDEYFRALIDVPIAEVLEAADALAKGTRWPKPGHWLEAAQRCRKASSQFQKFTPPVVLPDGTTETSYHCHHCQDTGWRPGCGCDLGRMSLTKRCPAHPYERYGMAYPEPLKPCDCRVGNPAWQANHQRRYVETEAQR